MIHERQTIEIYIKFKVLEQEINDYLSSDRTEKTKHYCKDSESAIIKKIEYLNRFVRGTISIEKLSEEEH